LETRSRTKEEGRILDIGSEMGMETLLGTLKFLMKGKGGVLNLGGRTENWTKTSVSKGIDGKEEEERVKWMGRDRRDEGL
jgi:hypothetical protein